MAVVWSRLVSLVATGSGGSEFLVRSRTGESRKNIFEKFQEKYRITLSPTLAFCFQASDAHGIGLLPRTIGPIWPTY